MYLYLYIVVQLPCLHADVPVGSGVPSFHFIHIFVLAFKELIYGGLFWFQMIYRI
jgi:hypothetical protein